MTQNGKGDKQRVKWNRDFADKYDSIFKKGKHRKERDGRKGDGTE